MGLGVAASVWTSVHALELLAGDYSIKILLAKTTYFGVVSAAPMWLLFCAAYTRQDKLLGTGIRWLLWVIPAITLTLVWTNESHGLIWPDITPFYAGAGVQVVYSHGPWFWIQVAYSYTLMAAGYALLVRAITKSRYLYSKQGTMLMVGVLMPWIGNVVYLAGFSPLPGLDLTAAACLLTTLILGWSLYRHHLLELGPVGRDAVMDHLLDSILVVDDNFRIADMNAFAEMMFQVKREACLGKPAEVLLPEWGKLKAAYGHDTTITREIEISQPVKRFLELRNAPLMDRRKKRLGALLILRDITLRREQEQELRKQSVALEAAAEEQARLMEAEAIAQERNRIAQEIHDGLAQTLAAMRMRVSRWRGYLESQPERMAAEIDEVEELVNTSLLEARRSIYALRPLALADQGFFIAMRQFVTVFGEYYGLTVTIDVCGHENRLPSRLEPVLFRIIQEALHNTAKHAGARNAWVRLNLDQPETLTLTLRDDGHGFDLSRLSVAEREGHIGLQAMRERVVAASGNMQMASRPDNGTEIVITFPRIERLA